MTTADLPWRQGRNERWDRIASRLAHWIPALWLLLLATHITGVILISGRPLWTLAVPAIPTAAIFVLILALEGWHQYAMCPVCARKVPLDPSAKIAQKRRRLRSLHWLSDRQKYVNRTLLVLLVLTFVPYANLVALPPLAISLAVITYLGHVHLPLQPWCPQCRRRWGKGGRHEHTPVPDPTGVGTR